MKKTLLFILFACAPFFMKAQCFVQVQNTPATCFGNCDGSATAFPSGGTSPYTYFWNPGGQTTQTITGLCAGTYTVIVIDANNCTSTGVTTVTQPQQLMVATSPTAASCQTCCDGFIISTVTGGTPPYVYMWTPTNQTTSTAQALCPGTYTLCVTDMNGCSTCTTTTVNFTSGIQDHSANGNLSVYPSPATQSVILDETFANATSSEISVCNLLGEIVFAKTSVSTTQLHETIDITELPNGIYFVNVKTESGNSIQKFVKE